MPGRYFGRSHASCQLRAQPRISDNRSLLVVNCRRSYISWQNVNNSAGDIGFYGQPPVLVARPPRQRLASSLVICLRLPPHADAPTLALRDLILFQGALYGLLIVPERSRAFSVSREGLPFRRKLQEQNLQLRRRGPQLLIRPGALPKTTSGKVQRDLTRRLWERGELEFLGQRQNAEAR